MPMKKKYGISLLMMVLTLTGCGNEKSTAEKEQREILQMEDSEDNKDIQRMPVSAHQENVKCGGVAYVLNIERKPDEKLPIIRSAVGNFMDNRILLSIQKNGKEFLKKSFTRNDFTPHVEFKETNQFRLEGLVFDAINTEENKELTFAANMTYPDSDLYIPFRIVVSQQGKCSISLDEGSRE